MKILKIVLVISTFLLMIQCGKSRSHGLAIVYADKIVGCGKPEVNFSAGGAKLNYLFPGAIVAFRIDQTILDQKGTSGKIYQLTRDLKLHEKGSFDTSLSDLELAKEYLLFKSVHDEDYKFDEIPLQQNLK